MSFGYEARNRLIADMFTSGDATVKMVSLRLSTLSQVEDANSAAWQAAYDKAIKDGRNESQATRIANEKVPTITAEQEGAVVSGDSSGADIPGVADSPAPTPSDGSDTSGDQVYPPTEEAKALVEKYGGRYLDPNTPAIDQLGETEYMIDDPSDSYGLRQIIVSAEMTSNMQVQMTRALGRITDPNEKKDDAPQRDGRERTQPISETDPYIRTPEDYRYDPGGVAKENFPKTYLGRTLAVTPDDRRKPIDKPQGYQSDSPDQYSYKRPGPQTDYAEAEFINKAQGLGGNVRGIIPQYRESDVFDMIANMTLPQILEFQTLSSDAGFYGEAGVASLPGQISLKDQEILGGLMGQANVSGETVWPMLEQYADVGRSRQGPSGPSGYVKEPFSVPAQLRQIPGEKTLAEEVKYRFRQKLGRDATDEELLGVASELGGYYTKSNQEQIALYLAAYDGDNQGLLTGAQMQSIEDPGAATSFDIADKWANEIDLNKRRETNSESFSRMLAATMGNRPSIGNQTAAGGVAQIGRQ